MQYEGLILQDIYNLTVKSIREQKRSVFNRANSTMNTKLYHSLLGFLFLTDHPTFTIRFKKFGYENISFGFGYNGPEEKGELYFSFDAPTGFGIVLTKEYKYSLHT